MEIEKVIADEQVKFTAELANEIWHQHFSGIISDCQIDYMLEKFQSYDAMKRQICEDGYQYFLMKDDNGGFFGYFAVAPKDNDLFLSKIYIKKESRGNGYARKAVEFIKNLVREMSLNGIFLTVNRGNADTVKIYKKMDFQIIDKVDTDIGNGFFMNDYIMRLEVK